MLWFRDHLDDLGGSLSRADELCRQLSEELSILRLVGEIGNKFFDSSDAFYAWRPDAFQLDEIRKEINEEDAQEPADEPPLTRMPPPSSTKRTSTTGTSSPKLRPQSPPILPEKDGQKSPPSMTESRLSRSGTITSYISSAYERAASNVVSLNAKMAKTSQGNLAGLRRDADEAEIAYRVGVKELDELRQVLGSANESFC